MGGRGAPSGFVGRVPNFNKATIADEKITKFLLSPTGKHYTEFVAVGYSANDPDKLKQDLLNGLSNNIAKEYGLNSHGERAFEVDMLLGVTYKTAFRTAWQIDKGSDAPRFITAHRLGRKRK